MKNKITATLITALAAWLLTSALCLPAFAQGTAFTYQGQLNNNGAVANGSYDLQFAIFNAAAGGSQIGSALTTNAESSSTHTTAAATRLSLHRVAESIYAPRHVREKSSWLRLK